MKPHLLSLIVYAAVIPVTRGDELLPKVAPIPAQTRQYYRLHPFFRQYTHVKGFPIVSSDKTSDYALLETAYQIREMTRNRPELLQVIGTNRYYFIVFGPNESAGNANLEVGDPTRRGWGGTTAAMGDKNILKLEGDPFPRTSMLMHEFAHSVHLTAMKALDPTFQKRLERIYDDALEAGKFPGEYRMKNPAEFWAVGVEVWFRNKITDPFYDAELGKLIAETYGNPAWRYQLPKDRADLGHLRGFDRSIWDNQKSEPVSTGTDAAPHESRPEPAARLKQVKELFDQGLISRDTYDLKRKEILDSL